MTASIERFKAEVLLGRPPVTRLAPSPTGRVHLGHALSGFMCMDLIRRLEGRFLLRIEDTDVERCRPELVGAMLEDLAWAGLRWEEPVLRQSEHFSFYGDAASRLEAMGLLYTCFATRSEILAAAGVGAVDPDGAAICAGLHKGLERGEIQRRKAGAQAFAVRLDMPRAIEAARRLGGPEVMAFTEIGDDLAPRRVAIEPERWGDVVIQRKGTPTSYHLSVVVDDARQGISIVTRGQDIRPSTDIHRLLQILLGLPAPIYAHHRLILGADGKKLSKRYRSTGLAELRAQGVSPDEVRARLAPMLERPFDGPSQMLPD